MKCTASAMISRIAFGGVLFLLCALSTCYAERRGIFRALIDRCLSQAVPRRSAEAAQKAEAASSPAATPQGSEFDQWFNRLWPLFHADGYSWIVRAETMKEVASGVIEPTFRRFEEMPKILIIDHRQTEEWWGQDKTGLRKRLEGALKTKPGVSRIVVKNLSGSLASLRDFTWACRSIAEENGISFVFFESPSDPLQKSGSAYNPFGYSDGAFFNFVTEFRLDD